MRLRSSLPQSEASYPVHKDLAGEALLQSQHLLVLLAGPISANRGRELGSGRRASFFLGLALRVSGARTRLNNDKQEKQN